MPRTIKSLLVGLALTTAASASAGVVFFEEENFRGRQFVVEGTVPNFVDRGFNDRALSAIVEGAPAEVCMDINFQGGCAILNPGRYPTLGALRSTISSVRMVSGRNDRDYRDYRDRDAGRERDFDRDRDNRRNDRRGAALTFFEEESFGGRQLTLEGTAPNFVDLGFNDRAVSAIVEGGSVEVCIDINFQGGCTVLNPGSYASLGALRNSISSVRLSPGRNNRGVGSIDRGGWDDHRGAAVTFFETENFGGRQLAVEGTAPNFVDRGFNDRAMSAIVEGSSVEVCVDINFQGGCTVLNPGQYPTLGSLGHAISSVRVVAGRDDRRNDDSNARNRRR